MTSILLRFPLPQRRCAEMWWSCARSRGKRIATCLRCGVDLVSNIATLPSVISIHVHTFQNIQSSVACCFDKISWATGVSVRLPPFFRKELFFWSRPDLEISCVVICLVILVWRAYLFWVCNANEVEPIIPVTSFRCEVGEVGEVGIAISCLLYLRVEKHSKSELKESGFIAVSMVMLP